jgi:hypothetical protein
VFQWLLCAASDGITDDTEKVQAALNGLRYQEWLMKRRGGVG